IPLLADSKLPMTILDKKSDNIKSKKLVLFNTHGSGHYLVDYKDADTKSELAEAIANQKIPAEGRIIRLNDMILLARKGNGSLVDALDIVKNCPDEPRDAVWGIMGRVIGLARMLSEGNLQIEQAIKDFRKKLAVKKYKQLGWDRRPEDTSNDVLLRQTILGIMLASETEDVVKEALDRYHKTKDIEGLPAELRTIILTAVVRLGKPEEIDKLMDIYQSSSNPDIQHSICSAVTDVRDAALAQHIINRSIAQDGFVRPQDIMRWYAYMMRNPHSRDAAWKWLVNDWDRLEKVFGSSKTMDYMPVYAAGPLSTTEWEKKYKDFFTPLLSHIALNRNIKVGFSEIEARVAWRKREEPKLKKYFQ
ncbi:MAG TPA: ERAP1-like C-terminal domain-containing protein, partial [Patescibacteria group bacterium]|nr:ERAP1-like C-terminal domain-containing protein [Patescibacteria group bacterium]